MADAFTLPEVARAAGVEYRTLHVWFRRGLFSASVRAENGTGHTNLFDLDDLARVRWLARLRALGLTLDGLELAAADPQPLIVALVDRPTPDPKAAGTSLDQNESPGGSP